MRVRPLEWIRQELDEAIELERWYSAHAPTGGGTPYSQFNEQENNRDIAKLEAELRSALAGELDLFLDGDPVNDHRVALPYFNRVTERLNTLVRAECRHLRPDEPLGRDEGVLAISGVGPGSFRVSFSTSPQQLSMTERPLVDRAIEAIMTVLRQPAPDAVSRWAERADERALKAMIGLVSAMASSQGSTSLRWRGSGGPEILATLSSAAARDLAIRLAGETGREILTVVGHLRLASDEPPRASIRTAGGDVYSATISQDLPLDRVKELLFGEVRATIVIDTATSPSTGQVSRSSEIVDLDAAND